MGWRLALIWLALLAVVSLACTPRTTATSTPAGASLVLSPTVTVSLPEQGKALARDHGCTACHSVEGYPSVGPAWKGLFGKEETLVGGVRVLVDEAYLRESIVSPNAKVVDGFQPAIMPQDFGTKLSAQQIQAIIEYIKTLK